MWKNILQHNQDIAEINTPSSPFYKPIMCLEKFLTIKLVKKIWNIFNKNYTIETYFDYE
jgi:hypothetical protein